jgi:hypothetical protein
MLTFVFPLSFSVLLPCSLLASHPIDIEYAVYYVGFLMLAYAGAVILFLFVEQPAANLLGLVMPK